MHKTKRDHLVESIAETDDDLTLKYLEGEEITNEELKSALRGAVIAGKITPVFCGTSLRNKGVQPLLDAVVEYLPSPLDIPAVRGFKPSSDEIVERASDDMAPFSALVF